MLGSKDKSSFGTSSSTTLISSEARIVGDVSFSGNLDIEGVIVGNVSAEPASDAVVRVIDQGRVEGEIRAPSVIINGDVVGDVYSSKHLELAANARVQGNVHYAQVEMAIGAAVNGSLSHGSGEAESAAGHVSATLDEPELGADEGYPAKT